MSILDRFYLKFFKKRFVSEYRDFLNKPPEGRALLYYKTDPFFLRKLAKEYVHTNFWEVLEIAKILNLFGFVVDVLDRSANARDIERLEDVYDIFIGIGSGESGRWYSAISSKLHKALHIFYATGANPDVSTKRMKERYAFFKERHPNANIVERRVITNIDLQNSMGRVDAIFSIGNSVTLETYAIFDKPMWQIYPSTSPAIFFDESKVSLKRRKKFLYFGGNGNITKGLDLCIEAFLESPDLELYICAPYEKDFDSVYHGALEEAPHIHWIGFVPVGGGMFDMLTEMCGFVVLPSASEGIATSVVTCMRRGLIPVVTREAGVDIGEFGFLLRDIAPSAISKQVRRISSIPEYWFEKRSLESYNESSKYTQENFSKTFTTALSGALALQKYEKKH